MSKHHSETETDPNYPGIKFLTTNLVNQAGQVVSSFPVREGGYTRHDGVHYPAGSTVRVK